MPLQSSTSIAAMNLAFEKALQQAREQEKPKNVPAVHGLTPGHSMFVSYPRPENELKAVSLLTYINDAEDGIIAFQVNGEQVFTLSNIYETVLKTPLAPELDRPVLRGGQMEPTRAFIITPQDWHEDMGGSYLSGPYRIHSSIEALKLIGAGDVPSFMQVYVGYIQDTKASLLELLRNDMMGEFAADDSLIFQNFDGEAKWKRAIHLHTGGRNTVHVPTFVTPITPARLMEGYQEQAAPRPLMN